MLIFALGNRMDLEFTKVQESDFESTFEVFKKHMKSVIESAFGWDEQFQESIDHKE
jgi:hypothetical protein